MNPDLLFEVFAFAFVIGALAGVCVVSPVITWSLDRMRDRREEAAMLARFKAGQRRHSPTPMGEDIF